MPNPLKYKSKDKFISDCMRIVTQEGKPQDQAAGQCYSMWRNRGKKKASIHDYIRILANNLLIR